jgi:hypothetical protein
MDNEKLYTDLMKVNDNHELNIGILKSIIESMRYQFRNDNEILRDKIEQLQLTIEHGKKKSSKLVLENMKMKELLRRILPQDEADWDKIIQQDSLYIDVKNFFRSFKND